MAPGKRGWCQIGVNLLRQRTTAEEAGLPSAITPRDNRRFLRFAVVGGSNGVVTFTVYTLLLAIGVAYPVAAIVGYAAGILNGYTWNRLWTFETGSFHFPEFSRYVVVQGSGLLLNLLLLYVLIDRLGMARGLSEILSIVPVVLLTYIFNRWWTFQPRTRSQPT
jgi:putative flippase GtrA